MKPTETSHLKTATLTHPGMTGKNNEDRLRTAAFHTSESDPTPVFFAMVADGVGGKQAGEVAAEIAVETVLEAVGASDGSDPVGTMQAAIREASRRIHARSVEDMGLAGMATTTTCAWVAGNRLFAANVGNSRLYLFRDGELRRISIDHSWVQEAIDVGILTPEQGRSHPNARIITRFVGGEDVEVDLRVRYGPEETDETMLANQGAELQPGDLLLICSDGLSDVVEDPEIEEALAEHDMEGALQALTDLANERGGPDNITSVAIRVPVPEPATVPVGDQAAEKPAASGRNRSPQVRLVIYLFSILLLVILVLIGYGYYLAFLK